ncbi:MAG: PAS domain S-box protein, partial [Acidobacteriota bacterium]|nr:PAS domain S-box protein [Acidobacteriota bacterium]
MKAPLSETESDRLEILRQHRILDTAPEQVFDDLTALASQVCGSPISLISLIDEERQWLKSKVGVGFTEVKRDISFCAHTILQPGLMMVRNTTKDERFADNPLVMGDPRVRFYAGVPLTSLEGAMLGTLCVIDLKARDLSAALQETLLALARQAAAHLRLCRVSIDLIQRNDELSQEVLERKRFEKRLRESEARYRTVTESASDAIITVDDGDKILFTNWATENVFGYIASEMIGARLTLLMPDCLHHVRATAFSDDETHDKHKHRQAVEVAGRHQDGSEIPLEISLGRYGTAEQRVLTVVIRDITERKRAAEAHRKAEEHRNLFRLACDPIIIFEPEKEIILDANDKACDVYGYQRKDFIGCGLKELTRKSEIGQSHPRESVAAGTYEEFEAVHYSADGKPLNFLINSSVIEYEGRRAVLSINRDISARKRAEAEFVVLEQEVLQAQKIESLGTLAGGIAHDFNNLLTVIMGNTQLASRQVEAGSSQAKRLDGIQEAATRAAGLTRQLLAFSRRQVLERRTINLNTT